MAVTLQNPLRSLAALTAVLLFGFWNICLPACCKPVESWEKVDRTVKNQVYQVNVGLILKLKDGQFAQLSDLSPKFRLPVYTTSQQFRGWRVMSYGTAFPVKTLKNDATYFLTSRHVVDKADLHIKECERFFAAMRLYADQTAAGRDAEGRYRELQTIVNWSQTKRMNIGEKTAYNQTLDAIWDCYETYLSERADPIRNMFKRYAAMVGVVSDTGNFIHPPGAATQTPFKGHLYRMSSGSVDEPDLALLMVKNTKIPALELEVLTPTEGQEVQVIGYPLESDQIDQDSAQYFTPTFSNGRVSRVTPRTLQVDAAVSVGNSGGPVLNLKGKVVGVVARRGRDVETNAEMKKFAAAVTVPCVRAFAPELFGKMPVTQ
jgi:hypothetical protein